MSAELFRKNILFLQKHASENTCRNVSNAPMNSGRLRVEALNSGMNAFYFRGNGSEVLLHSRRRPEEEAAAWILSWRRNRENIRGNEMFAILGTGGGFHIAELSNGLKPGALVFVADLNPADFSVFLHHVCLKDICGGSAEFYFAVSVNPAEIASEFRAVLAGRLNFNVQSFTHPGLNRILGKEYSALRRTLLKEFSLDAMNRKTRALYSPDWHRNIIMNMPANFSEPPADILKGAFEGGTAVVAGAGPSLTAALPYIREIRDRVVLFAVGTAVKPLCSAGIKPDFTVAVDCSPKIISQYQGAEVENTFLFAEPLVSPDVFDLFSGHLFRIATGAVPEFNSWLDKEGVRPELFRSGGTVALTAFELARFAGCRDIVFTGVDLAVSEDGTSHASNSVYDSNKLEKNELTEVEGNYGNTVLTTFQFRDYINIMRNYFGNSFTNVNFINITAGGAFLGESVKAVKPPEMPTLGFPALPVAVKAKVDGLKASFKKRGPKEIEGLFEKLISEIKEIISLSGKAASATRIMGRSAGISASGRLGSEMSKLEKQIKKLESGCTFVNTAMHRALLKFYSEDGNDGNSGPECSSAEFFYSELSKTSGITLNLMRESFKKFKKEQSETKGEINNDRRKRNDC